MKELPKETQERIRYLLDKANNGTLTSEDKTEMDRLAEEVDELELENAKAAAPSRNMPVFRLRATVDRTVEIRPKKMKVTVKKPTTRSRKTARS